MTDRQAAAPLNSGPENPDWGCFMSKSLKSIEFYRILQKQSLQRLTRSDAPT
jgi:hypothetical protein